MNHPKSYLRPDMSQKVDRKRMKRNEPSELCLPEVVSKKSNSEVHAWYWHTHYDLGWSRLSKCTWPKIKWNTVITLFSCTVFHPFSCSIICFFVFKNHDTGVFGWMFYIFTSSFLDKTKQITPCAWAWKLCQKTTTKYVFHFFWNKLCCRRDVWGNTFIHDWTC